LGIGIFSPLLDAQGNSARGIRVCTDLSRELALHVFNSGIAPLPAMRLKYDNAQVRSRRRRPQAQRDVLSQEGQRIRVLELQGDLVFSTIEPVLRSAHEEGDACRYFIFNLRYVISADDTSLRLIAQAQEALAARGVRLFVCSARALHQRLSRFGLDPQSLFPTDDAALEACENLLLADLMGDAVQTTALLSLGECELLDKLPAQDIAWLDDALAERNYAAGETIVRAGDPGNALFLLLGGSVEVRLPSAPRRPGKRIDVFTAGMAFGEMAFIDGSPRSADVIAMESVRCRILDRETFMRMDTDHPGIKIALLQQITRQLSINLRRINAEVLAFKG
jgi:glutaminase